MTIEILFHECEHPGDLNNYIDDITSSGGDIISKEIYYDSETALVEISVENKNEFVTTFRKTNAFDFAYVTEKNHERLV